MKAKRLQPVKAQLELQTILFHRVLSEIDDDEANKSPDENSIPAKWIAGHIVNTRITLWSILSGKAVTYNLMESLDTCTDDFLASKPPFLTSIPDTTIMGLIAFFVIHEAHHMGQISVLRRLAGTNPVSDFKLYENVICN